MWCSSEIRVTSVIAPTTTLHITFLPKEGACKAVLGAKGMTLLQITPLEMFTLGMALSMGEVRWLCMKKYAWHRVKRNHSS